MSPSGPAITDWLMAGVTAAYAIVAFFQWLAIRRQAKIAADGVSETKRAVEAADKSATIAEKSLTLLERPWVSVSIEQPFRPARNPQPLVLKITNTGRTPAIVKRQGFVVQWHSEMPKYPLDRKDMEVLPTEFIVHTGQSISSGLPISPFSQQEIDDIFQGKQILAVYGSVLYDDIL